MAAAVLSREKILSVALPSVSVAAGEGTIKFEALSANDVDFVRGILAESPVDFALSLMANQARGDPSRAVLAALPRPTLLRACRTWASHSSTLGVDPRSIKRFDDVRRSAAEKLVGWDQTTRAVARRLSQVVPKLDFKIPNVLHRELRKIQLVSDQIAELASGLTSITAQVVSSFRSAIPDPQGLAVALAEANDGKAHLDDHGYGFVTMDWDIPQLRRIMRERPSLRETHHEFLRYTREQSFGSKLLKRVKSSGTLSRRAPILRSAVDAHIRRDYSLSVPVLYAQLEGVLADLLIVEGLARRSGGTARKAQTGGKLRGFQEKAKQYGKGASVARHFITQGILEALAPERNAVLHGSKTQYRQASRSVRLLLLIDTLVGIVVEMEVQPVQSEV